MNPLLLTDFYKVDHRRQYPQGTTLVYSNFTPRKSRMEGMDKIVFFGLQLFIDSMNYKFNRFFFSQNIDHVINEMKEYLSPTVGEDFDYQHIRDLHHLGYLPLKIKALPEGSLVPMGIPILTIRNTHPDFFWLVNYIETWLSCTLWPACTSATTAYQYRKVLEHYADITGADKSFIDWQAHDFSFRGMFTIDAAIASGMAHLLSFKGTDTIPAIHVLKHAYKAKWLIGASVPATEHSVMCAGGKENELETYKRLLTEIYPSGIVSIVSDTWDLWNVIANYLPELKDIIMGRNGKLVIRPDSGDPVDILCGIPCFSVKNEYRELDNEDMNEDMGVIESLWHIFGGTINEKGYKVLDSHIGCIYGDSITLDRCKEICKRLEAKGFCSSNVVFGIGSYTYQYVTRDTFGFAMKATYIEVNGEGREIFKDPITDDGTKKSAKGLLMVQSYDDDKHFSLMDQCAWEEERRGALKTIYHDGEISKETFEQIRNRLHAQA